MNSQAQKAKTFFATSLILSGVGAILYLLCYFLASDSTDYFVSGHPLPALANSLSIASLLWFLSACFLIPKDTLPTEDFMTGTGKPFAVAMAPIIGAIAAGSISLTYFEPIELFAMLLGNQKFNVTPICAALAVIGAILAGVYYFFRMINSSNLNNMCVVLGIGPAAMMAGLCGLTYFELDHHMNAPAKIGMQLAWIASMLFLTCELRVTLGKPQPRRYLATACIAMFANACAAVPAITILTKSTETVHATRILGFALLCACNFIYIGYRLFQFTECCSLCTQPTPTDTTPIPDQTQGKDDQDGCQQQDSMAS